VAYPSCTIQDIARGISRQQTEREMSPYVEPTTDWIRLEQRFRATLVLQDPGPQVAPHIGSDARALIIY
jgi:multidrug efflux system membrane fusion protein